MRLPFTLQESESVLLTCRRHWMYLYPKLVALALVAIVPVAALTAGIAWGPGLGGVTGLIVLAADVVWGGYWLARLYFTWYRHNNDVWVVTDQRLVDSVRRHWFHHRMASADLVDVEDMAVVKHGLLPTLFNFGDVRCQTAGEQPNFILAGIPKPADVLGTIDSSRDAARRSLAQPQMTT